MAFYNRGVFDVDNPDNCLNTGMYFLDEGKYYGDITNGIVTSLSWNNNVVIHMITDYGGYIIKYRIKWWSSWYPWVELSNSNHTHEYLPLSGGTITGNLNSSGSLFIKGIMYMKNNSDHLGNYGDHLPTSYLSETRLFFKKA